MTLMVMHLGTLTQHLGTNQEEALPKDLAMSFILTFEFG
jgi:hypothetical protein